MDRDEYACTIESGAAILVESPSESGGNTPVESSMDGPVESPVDAVESAAQPPQLAIEATDVGEVSAPHVIEALLFASDAPLSAGRLAELAGSGTAGDVRRHIATLNEKYAAAGLSFRIEEIARGYQMLTVPAYQAYLAKLDKHRSQTRLTGATLEALSIIAYKQPVIRADIEAIRGVACGEVLNRLREMGLIKIVGRAEIVGRPILYGTTRKFLDVFGLADLEDLPPMEALSLRRANASASQAASPVMPAEVPAVAAGA